MTRAARDPHDLASLRHEFDERYYLEWNPDVAAVGADALDHYRVHGWREGRDPSPTFKGFEHLALYEQAATYFSPLDHFVLNGGNERLSASIADYIHRYARDISNITTADIDDALHLIKLRRPGFLQRAEKPDYLIKYLSNQEKSRLGAINAAVLISRFDIDDLAALCDAGINLGATGDYKIILTLVKDVHREGDIALALICDSTKLYELSFSFVDFAVARGEASEKLVSIVVARIQGVKGCAEAVKVAAGALGVQPALALLAALDGLSHALKIRNVYAVKAEMQLSYQPNSSRVSTRNYDDFFVQHGYRENQAGLLKREVRTGVDILGGAHRRRAKMRREMRSRISDAARAALGERFSVASVV